jgi:hypothetical protein
VRTHSKWGHLLGVSLVWMAVLLVVVIVGRVEGRDGQQSKPANASAAKEKPKPEAPAARDIEHVVIIMPSQENPDKCMCVDAELARQGKYTQQVKAGRSEWVVWENKMERDVTLVFGMSKRLFGVKEAVVYAQGEPLKLRIRADASTEGEHEYRPTDCDVTQPGPVIIVTPPPTP